MAIPQHHRNSKRNSKKIATFCDLNNRSAPKPKTEHTAHPQMRYLGTEIEKKDFLQEDDKKTEQNPKPKEKKNQRTQPETKTNQRENLYFQSSFSFSCRVVKQSMTYKFATSYPACESNDRNCMVYGIKQ